MSAEESKPIEKILVVGAHTVLGSLIIDDLEKNPEVSEFWVLDLHTPKKKFKKLRFIKLDLVEPGNDELLSEKLSEHGITTLLHCALKTNPSFNWMSAHELEVIGTLTLINAAKAAGLRKFILCSTTAVYGASPKNPNYIKESAPLLASKQIGFIRDKVEAEKLVARLYEDDPKMIVTVLRFGLILGPHSKNYFTEVFRRPVMLTLLGYDPLMQFIHETDALDALKIAIATDHRTTFNIVGRSVIPLSYALRESGKIRLPLITSIAYPFIQALWTMHIAAVPGKVLDYFRYLCVADGEKAKLVMGFKPKFSSKEAFLEFTKTKRRQEYQWAQ